MSYAIARSSVASTSLSLPVSKLKVTPSAAQIEKAKRKMAIVRKSGGG